MADPTTTYATDTDFENEATPERDFGLSEEQAIAMTQALQKGDRIQVLDLYSTLHPADVAEYISQIDSEQRKQFINLIRKGFDPDILVELESGLREEVIQLLGTKESANVIQDLDTDDAVYVIEDLNRADQKKLLDAIPTEQRIEVEKTLSYPENSAGRLMQQHVVSLPEDWDVGKTIDFLRGQEELPEDFYEIYVVDRERHPVGSVQVSRILRNKRTTPIKELMNINLKAISVLMDQEDVAHLFHKYALISTPVVSEQGKLLGVIEIDDIVDIITEEAEEDILRLAGVEETDIHSKPALTARHRFPWLFINLLTAILASAVIAMFSHSIEQIVALAVMMPIVASMGGNAGTQSVTVAVRALATKDLNDKNARRVIYKEMLVGLFNGIALAIICGVVAYFYYHSISLSFVFASAIIVTLVAAGFAGAWIPLLLERMRIDPAIASTVFLTTVTDVVGFLAFLGVATLLLL